jgi:hypothetical protein
VYPATGERSVDGWRRAVPALLAASTLIIGCGAGRDGSGPPAMSDDPHGSPGAHTDAPGPWAPSRALALERFALETALGVALGEPAGDELSSSTRWTLRGNGVDLRFDVRSWFNRAEAELRCRDAAGDGAQPSLDLGAPVWIASDAVFLTRANACVRVSVNRGSAIDAAGARAVARVLVHGR